MAVEEDSKASEALAVCSSNIGDVLDRHCAITARDSTSPDGTVTTSEIARAEKNKWLEGQPPAVTLTGEQFNQVLWIHNAEVRADGHPSQVIEPIWGTPQVIDEYGNRRLQQHNFQTISSDNSSELSPPLTTSYRGSIFRSHRKRQGKG